MFSQSSFRGHHHPVIPVRTLALVCFLPFVGPIGCDGSDGSDGVDGEPSGPLISNISTEGAPVAPGGQIQVFVSASSPTGEALSYDWEIPEGWDGTDTDDDLLVLTAPEEQAAGGEVSVAVSDGERTRSAAVQVATRGPTIENFNADFTEPLEAGDTIAFSVDAYNRDGKVLLRYDYGVGGMGFDDRGSEWSWDLTQRAMGGRYLLEGIVEDHEQLRARAGVEVTLEGKSEWPAYGGDRQRTGQSPSPDAEGAAGNQIWDTEQAIEGAVSSAPALAADGTIYVGSNGSEESGMVYALNPGDDPADRVKWSYETGDDVRSSPALGADGTVYVGSEDNRIYALNPEEQAAERVKWSYETGDNVRSSPAVGADGTVYVGSFDGTVYALNPGKDAEERVKWAYETEGTVVAGAPALAADGTIYVGSNNELGEGGMVYALNPGDGSDGRVKWRFETQGRFIRGSALGADGTIYVNSTDGFFGSDHEISALNPEEDATERLKWSFGIDSVIQTSPAVSTAGTVYVAAIDQIYALNPGENPEDRLKWSHQHEHTLWRSSPVIGADGTVYVGDGPHNSQDEGNVYALNPGDDPADRVKWTHEIGHQVKSSPALTTNGTILVGAYEEKVHAIR